MKKLSIKVGVDENGQYPICPHCENKLTIISDHRSHLKFMSNMHVFCCPHCRKVLSITTASK